MNFLSDLNNQLLRSTEVSFPSMVEDTIQGRLSVLPLFKYGKIYAFSSSEWDNLRYDRFIKFSLLESVVNDGFLADALFFESVTEFLVETYGYAIWNFTGDNSIVSRGTVHEVSAKESLFSTLYEMRSAVRFEDRASVKWYMRPDTALALDNMLFSNYLSVTPKNMRPEATGNLLGIPIVFDERMSSLEGGGIPIALVNMEKVMRPLGRPRFSVTEVVKYAQENSVYTVKVSCLGSPVENSGALFLKMT